ncbi:MAG: F0F1 ATP synthase subunit epsilon [Alphaproteobacteria bacterium]
MNLHVEIASSQGMLFQGNCHLAVIPALSGEIGVMDNHESFLASLKEGEIKIFDHQNNLIKSLPLESGFAEMQNSKLIILIN